MPIGRPKGPGRRKGGTVRRSNPHGVIRNRVNRNDADSVVINEPTDIASLRLWLDASDEPTISSVGSNVNRISDKSGFGNDAIENSASRQPNTGTRTLNGLNVLDFSGGSDRLRVIDSLGFMFRDGGTILMVVDVDARTNGRRFIDCAAMLQVRNANVNGVTGPHFEARCLTSGGPNSLLRTTENIELGPQLIVFMEDCNLPQPHVHRIKSYGDDLEVNELNQGGGSPSNINDLGILSRRGGGNGRLDAALGEILYFDEILGSVQLKVMEDYLNRKWGLGG